MDILQELVQNNEAALPKTAKPINEFFREEKEGEKIYKRVITNKLGHKKTIWVKLKEEDVR